MDAEVVIQNTMTQHRMDRPTAIYFLQQTEALRHVKVPFPLGRTGMANDDEEYAAWAAKYPELAARHEVK